MKSVKIYRIILLVLVYTLQSAAGIVVRPTYLFINSPEKSSSVTVRNTSENLIEVSVELKYGYFFSDENGNFQMETSDTLDNYHKSLLKFIKVYPQTFTLAPEESRSIRVYIDIPNGSEQYEYWARMYFTPKVLQKLQIKKSQPMVDMITIVDIPVNYRLGNVSTGIIFEKISDIKENNNKITFNALLRKIGNASYWGSLNVKLLDKSGKTKGSIIKNISVYKKSKIPIEIPLEDKFENIHKIQITAETNRKDIDRKKLLQSKNEIFVISLKSKD